MPLPCEAGTFGPSTGLQSQLQCMTCPSGFFCATGATEPLPCGAGRFGSEPNLRDAQCNGPCAAGHFCPEGTMSSVLDATNTSSGSFVSYRLFEQVKCLTAPGENALWFMYEPLLMSKDTWDELSKEQQDAVMAAGQEAEEYFDSQAKAIDQKMVDVFTENGVEIATMSKEDYDAWLAIAQETSYKNFAEQVEGGKELIDQALAVE